MSETTSMQNEIFRCKQMYHMCETGLFVAIPSVVIGVALPNFSELLSISRYNLLIVGMMLCQATLITFAIGLASWYLKILIISSRIDEVDLLTLISICGSKEARPSNLQGLICNALVTLIPEIEIDNSSLLEKIEWNNLYKELEGNHKQLIIVILELLKKTCVTDAIPFVRKLANGKTATASDPDVNKLACQCLTVLMAQYEKQKQPHMLLRASDSLPSPEMLLRPVTEIEQITPEQITQLLRPTIEQDEVVVTKPTILPPAKQSTLQETEQLLCLGHRQDQSHSE